MLIFIVKFNIIMSPVPATKPRTPPPPLSFSRPLRPPPPSLTPRLSVVSTPAHRPTSPTPTWTPSSPLVLRHPLPHLSVHLPLRVQWLDWVVGVVLQQETPPALLPGQVRCGHLHSQQTGLCRAPVTPESLENLPHDGDEVRHPGHGKSRVSAGHTPPCPTGKTTREESWCLLLRRVKNLTGDS